MVGNIDIQLINDFRKFVNRETILELVESGVPLDEVWEILADRVWEDWKSREYGGYACLETDYNIYPVQLTQELRDQLPGRLANFKNILAEVAFVKYLKELGFEAHNAPISLDFAGVDVVIKDDFTGMDIRVAVLRDTAFSWSKYYKKYGNQKLVHYYFTFDHYENISLELVKNWAAENLLA